MDLCSKYLLLCALIIIIHYRDIRLGFVCGMCGSSKGSSMWLTFINIVACGGSAGHCGLH